MAFISRRHLIIGGAGLGVAAPLFAQDLIEVLGRSTPAQELGPFYPPVRPLDQDSDLTRLADGTRISLLEDWPGSDARSLFLREVRDGACDLFATVLSPDYNEAHRDHLHLDQAQRGSFGWRGCR